MRALLEDAFARWCRHDDDGRNSHRSGRQTSLVRHRGHCLDAPVLLQADYVDRSKPPVTTVPLRRRVLRSVFLGQRELPSKGVLIFVSGNSLADRAHRHRARSVRRPPLTYIKRDKNNRDIEETRHRMCGKRACLTKSCRIWRTATCAASGHVYTITVIRGDRRFRRSDRDQPELLQFPPAPPICATA